MRDPTDDVLWPLFSVGLCRASQGHPVRHDVTWASVALLEIGLGLAFRLDDLKGIFVKIQPTL